MTGDDGHSFEGGIKVKSLEYFKSVRFGLVGDDGLAARERPVDGSQRRLLQRIADDVVVEHRQRVARGQRLDRLQRRRRRRRHVVATFGDVETRDAWRWRVGGRDAGGG